jgi:hypothetical protein
VIKIAFTLCCSDDSSEDPEWKDQVTCSESEAGDSELDLKSVKRGKRDKEKDRKRARLYRSKMTDVQKDRIRTQARARMRKYRERKKEVTVQKHLSPGEKKKLRAQWRQAKRKQRASMTAERKKELSKLHLQRKLNALTPEEFQDILLATTPRKMAHLKKEHLLNSPKTVKRMKVSRSLADSFESGLAALKNKKDNDSRAKRKILGVIAQKASKACETSKVRAYLNVRSETWQMFGSVSEEATLLDLKTRKERSDTLRKTLKTQVFKFYSTKSIPLPDKRHAEKSVLTDTTSRLQKTLLLRTKGNPFHLHHLRSCVQNT